MDPVQGASGCNGGRIHPLWLQHLVLNGDTCDVTAAGSVPALRRRTAPRSNTMPPMPRRPQRYALRPPLPVPSPAFKTPLLVEVSIVPSLRYLQSASQLLYPSGGVPLQTSVRICTSARGVTRRVVRHMLPKATVLLGLSPYHKNIPSTLAPCSGTRLYIQ